MKRPSESRIAFTIFCFIFGAFPCRAAGDEKTAMPVLSVVRTWGDLAAQKPVMTQPSPQDGKPAPAPLACKLGISDSEGEHYGGVVLYCLVEHGGDEAGSLPGRGTLGPFRVDVGFAEPADIQIAKDEQKVSGLFLAVKSGSACLYMKIITLAKVGDYHVQVRKQMDDAKQSQLKPVAAATVKVLEKHGMLWSPWGDPDSQPMDAQGLVKEGDYSLMKVANPAGGVAIPTWQGAYAAVIAKVPDAKLPLPQIIPFEADPGVQLDMKESVLTVKLADDEVSTYYPDDHFLTRWWVNGKPVQFKPDVPGMNRPRALAAAEKLVKEIRFRMEFHPDRLGVKKGDKVGVQLLFCPQGWGCSGEGIMEAMKSTISVEDKLEPWRISRMSNRVNFVYSGDPASPAAQ